MRLDSLRPPKGARKKVKRIGRGEGSGHGGTSTKGHKGQKARSGGKNKPGFEGGQMPMSRRLPKRGFRNFFRKDYAIVNIEQLNKFPEGSVIDAEALLKAGILNKTLDGIKLLARGAIAYPVNIKINMISGAAKQKIESAGGTVEVI
jgi:large subunit ribosomal protein L15